MLSVLIPTYDYQCYTLVHNLHQQLEEAGLEYEIIVTDDGGRDQVVAIANHKINDLSHSRYIRNRCNVGRAHNLNNMINMASGQWCLIIDCDAKVVRPDFISHYLQTIKQYPDIDIISGDLVNPDSLPSPEVTLRYRYEKAAEPERTVEKRSEHPYHHFTTFNILIRRDALIEVPFDSDCTDYGYEDSLMGIEMQRHGKHIIHIDNPLMHMGFDRNAVYLRKVETALHTLHKLGDKMLPYTGIGRTISRLDNMHATWAVRLLYRVLRPFLRHNLLGSAPSVFILNFYKLGYFLTIPCISSTK